MDPLTSRVLKTVGGKKKIKLNKAGDEVIVDPEVKPVNERHKMLGVEYAKRLIRKRTKPNEQSQIVEYHGHTEQAIAAAAERSYNIVEARKTHPGTSLLKKIKELQQRKQPELCPGCKSADIKTYSHGEKECNQCHRTWDVKP